VNTYAVYAIRPFVRHAFCIGNGKEYMQKDLQVLHARGGMRSVSFPFFLPQRKRGDPDDTSVAGIQLHVLLSN
jgi:hypothetical protein